MIEFFSIESISHREILALTRYIFFFHVILGNIIPVYIKRIISNYLDKSLPRDIILRLKATVIDREKTQPSNTAFCTCISPWIMSSETSISCLEPRRRGNKPLVTHRVVRKLGRYLSWPVNNESITCHYAVRILLLCVLNPQVKLVILIINSTRVGFVYVAFIIALA